MGDGRCDDCRLGHYALANGVVSNFPCTTEGCGCWFCGPVVTPAQSAARAAAGEHEEHTMTPKEPKETQ